MRKKLLALALLSFLTLALYSQENIRKDSLRINIRQSALYATLGIFPVYSNVNLSYEIMLFERPDRFFKRRGFRASSGLYQYYEDGSLNTLITYTLLSGGKNTHLELGMGLTYMQFLTVEQFFIVPALNLGYRYQKPQGKFIFRTGAGWPELVFLSFGYAFN